MKATSPLVLAVALTFALLWVGSGNTQDISETIYQSYSQKVQLKDIPKDLSMEQALKAQAGLIELLKKDLGKPVGYKAGLTNPKAQEAFGVAEPVAGVLLEKMLLKGGAKIGAQFGARPVSEGDLIVRVKDEKINSAKTPLEALNSLDAIIPFIELPDLLFSPDVKMTGPMIVAINVGARYGVMGEPIPIQPGQECLERLRNFKLQILNEKNEVVSEGTGSALLGDPLKVVLWLAQNLKTRGQSLKKGDLLSLGTITKMMPTAPNTVVKARYLDLDPKGPVEVMVSFN